MSETNLGDASASNGSTHQPPSHGSTIFNNHSYANMSVHVNGAAPVSHGHNYSQQSVPSQFQNIQRGFKGLPIFPHELLPASKIGITSDHAEKYYFYACILDPSARNRFETSEPMTTNTVSAFQKRLEILHDCVNKKSKELFREKITESCNDDGLLNNQKPLRNYTGFNDILASSAMKDAFLRDFKIPFHFTMSHVYQHCVENRFHEWLHRGLQYHFRERNQCPFDYELKCLKNTGRGSATHTIMSSGVKACNSIVEGFHDKEEALFGMSLRTRARRKATPGFHQVVVSMIECNPDQIKTYLLVNMARYPSLPKDPLESDLRNNPRDMRYYHAYMLAGECKKAGAKKEEATSCFEQVLRSVYDKGDQGFFGQTREVCRMGNAPLYIPNVNQELAKEYLKHDPQAMLGNVNPSTNVNSFGEPHSHVARDVACNRTQERQHGLQAMQYQQTQEQQHTVKNGEQQQLNYQNSASVAYQQDLLFDETCLSSPIGGNSLGTDLISPFEMFKPSCENDVLKVRQSCHVCVLFLYLLLMSCP